MLRALPGFGTNNKSGHEERIKHHEENRGGKEEMQREAGAETQNEADLK